MPTQRLTPLTSPPDIFLGAALPVDSAGFHSACGVIGVGAAELWAVLGVETTGCGFLPDRRPKILFERHVFSRETRGSFDASDPDISSPAPGGYGQSGAAQYVRLQRAIGLDRQAALRSASWGIGQVMGNNASAAGYANVETMVTGMASSESEQLLAMTRFIASQGLAAALKTHDWPAFARGYNGPDYAARSYDTRLGASYYRYVYGALPDLTVRTAQVLLLFLGYEPGMADGILGRFTLGALHDFRTTAGLPQVDNIDAATLGALVEAVVHLHT
jgi:hypothetical protein